LWLGKIEISVAAQATFTLAAEPFFKGGCEGADVFLGDVSQQVLFAQHAGWHAFSLGALMRTHGRAERPTGARTTAIASNNEAAILPAIAFTV
jgi:hypothetical protein